MAKFCPSCGSEVNENAVICVKCGTSLPKSTESTPSANNNPAPVNVDNNINVLFVILSVLVPLFGIIYWAVAAKTAPRCAKACGIAGIISWAASFLLVFVVYFFYFLILFSL